MEPYVTFVSGAGAGLVGGVLCSPLDVSKARIQVQAAVLPHLKYSGVYSTLRMIVREEGVRGLYRGITPALITIPLFWATYFTTYETLKTHLKDQDGSITTGYTIVAAISAGGIADCITNPLWVVRLRMQTNHLHANQPKGIYSTVRSIHAKEGVKAFYKGLTASFVGLSHVAVQFPLYETIKSRARARRPDGKETAIDLIAAAAISKGTASTLSYPHEVVRSRLMDSRVPLNAIATTRRILAEEGVAALYAGLNVNLVRVIPQCIATFVSYELISRYLMECLNGHQL